MKTKYYVHFLLTLLPTTNHAVLIQAETLTLGSRTIILFSEEHKNNASADLEQCKTFEKLLLNREKEAPLLHILVEQPIWKSIFAEDCISQSVTEKIVDRFEPCPLKRTTIRNAEIRFSSYIACHILDEERDPLEFDLHATWNMGDRTYTSTSLKILDLQEEFTHYITLIKQAREDIQPIWQKEALGYAIERALNEYQKFETLIITYNIDVNTSILNLAIDLYLKMQDPENTIGQQAQHQKRDLSTAILNAFAQLLDASLLTKTFQIAEGNIAIIAGYRHISRIRQLLSMHVQSTSSFGGLSIDPAQQKTLTPSQIASALSMRQSRGWAQIFCSCFA